MEKVVLIEATGPEIFLSNFEPSLDKACERITEAVKASLVYNLKIDMTVHSKMQESLREKLSAEGIFTVKFRSNVEDHWIEIEGNPYAHANQIAEANRCIEQIETLFETEAEISGRTVTVKLEVPEEAQSLVEDALKKKKWQSIYFRHSKRQGHTVVLTY